VRCEAVDLAESSIPDASCGMAIVQQLGNVIAEAPHEIEPSSRHSGEVRRLDLEPAVDGRVVRGEGHDVRNSGTAWRSP
jgi:hypothetical protein